MATKPSNLARILRDDDFLSVTSGLQDRLTKKVMAQATPEEDRIAALTEFHALERILAAMRSAASTKD